MKRVVNAPTRFSAFPDFSRRMNSTAHLAQKHRTHECIRGLIRENPLKRIINAPTRFSAFPNSSHRIHSMAQAAQ
ncbi:MAG TPA: hypothetical protein VJ020_12635 [Anaerolineales bacterium]|nr:hypothetical protein [Anaerolineales bacterium]